MTVGHSWASDSRKALLALTVGFLVVTTLLVLGGLIDLHDRKTWNQRGRYESGPRWYSIDAVQNPDGFKQVIMFRYVLPITVFGTATVICLLGALAQPKKRMS
jgi:hypothetical protein